MTVDIYPAIKAGKHIDHADEWRDESTLNLANNNFHNLMGTLGLSHLAQEVPGSMSLKAMEMALQTSEHTRYTERLKKLCAVAHIKKATLIAFS